LADRRARSQPERTRPEGPSSIKFYELWDNLAFRIVVHLNARVHSPVQSSRAAGLWLLGGLAGLGCAAQANEAGRAVGWGV